MRCQRLFHAVCAIAGDDHEILEPACGESVDLPGDQRAAADVEKRLGNIGGERQEAVCPGRRRE